MYITHAVWSVHVTSVIYINVTSAREKSTTNQKATYITWAFYLSVSTLCDFQLVSVIHVFIQKKAKKKNKNKVKKQPLISYMCWRESSVSECERVHVQARLNGLKKKKKNV